MTLHWTAKAPAEVVFREIPWQGLLEGDEIDTTDVSNALTLEPGTSTLVLSDVVFNADTVTATVTGGAIGDYAILTNKVTTLDGRTLQQSILMQVLDPADADEPTGPSTTTKRVVVEMAYRICSLAGYEFDQTPEELQAGITDMDAIMAGHAMLNLSMGYNFPAVFGGGDLDDAFGCPDGVIRWAALELANALAASLGKSLPREVIFEHRKWDSQVRGAFAPPPRSPLSGRTPLGSGNRSSVGWGAYAWENGRATAR